MYTVHTDDFVGTKVSCMHRFFLPMVLHCACFVYARAPLIPKNTRTCLAEQDQAVSYINYVGYCDKQFTKGV